MQKRILCALLPLLLISTNVIAKNKVSHKSKTIQSHTRYHPTNDLECLSRNIYHEASGESEEGQKAVGMITINRAKSDSKAFKNTICNVVYQSGEFSWVAKNPSIKDTETYNKIKVIAKKLYDDYYINSIVPDKLQILKNVMYFSRGTPKGFTTVTTIGNHKFSKPEPIKTKKSKHKRA